MSNHIEITVDEEVYNITVDIQECGGGNSFQSFAEDPADPTVIIWRDTTTDQIKYRTAAGEVRTLGTSQGAELTDTFGRII